MELARQHVIIVGGSSGIGLGVARAVLAEGARATIVGRSRERLARAHEELGDDERVRTVAADISQEADVARLFDLAADFDHLITTAIDAAYQPITELEIGAVQRVLSSKLVGSLLLAKHASKRISARGSITFTSGIAASRPSPGGAAVAAVNGALEALGRALAVELAPVRVNVVSPGWVDTPVWDTFAGARKEVILASMADRLPVGRVGTAADLARAYIFVMQSEYSTGAVVHVDGGHRLV